MISFVTLFTATAAQSVMRLVCCEQCSARYVYPITREKTVKTAVEGLHKENSARGRRIQGSARRTLGKALRKGCEPVPCPQCGWYQAHMRDRAGALATRWLHTVAVYLAVGGVISLIPLWLLANLLQQPARQNDLVAPAIVGCVLFIAFVALVLRAIARSKYDPNRNAAALKRLTTKLPEGIPLDEFKQLADQATRELFERFQTKPRSVRDFLTQDRKLALPLWLLEAECQPLTSTSVALADGSVATITFPRESREGTLLTPLIGQQPHPIIVLRVRLLTEVNTVRTLLAAPETQP